MKTSKTPEPINFKLARSNKLIESRNFFTAIQQRAILLAIAQIRPDAEKLEPYKIHFREVLNLTPEQKIKGAQYDQVRDNLMALTRTSIDVLDGGNWNSKSFIDEVDRKAKDDFVMLEFSEKARPFLLNLKKEGFYTTYTLGNVIHLKNKYAIRLYELCKQYEKIGYREIDFQLFREMLYIDSLKTYTKPSKVTSFIVKPGIEEINNNPYSDLHIEFEVNKKKYKMPHYFFWIKRKENQEPQILDVPHVEVSGAPRPQVKPEKKPETKQAAPKENQTTEKESPQDPFFAKLAKKYDKRTLDYYTKRIEAMDSVTNKRGYLLKALKEKYYENELRVAEKKKVQQNAKKQAKKAKQQAEEQRQKAIQEYDDFLKDLLARYLAQGTEEDKELFLFEIEDSENSQERKYFAEFEGGNPSSLAKKFYARYLVRTYGSQEEVSFLEFDSWQEKNSN